MTGEAMTQAPNPAPPDEPRLERVLEATCAGCGGTFEPVRPHQKHCRNSCRKAAFERRQGQRTAPRVPWQLFE